MSQPGIDDDLLDRIRGGDGGALAEVFSQCRPRLRRMVQLRMDRRLQGRLDPSDVLQEAWLDASKRAGEYAAHPTMSFFLWLRLLTGQKLLEIHRRHLGAKLRDAGREVSLYRGALPQASSVCLAAQLLGRLTTASQAAMRAERQRQIQEALDKLEPLDREILALRHFEELSNSEAAEALGLTKSAASNRYVRALMGSLHRSHRATAGVA